MGEFPRVLLIDDNTDLIENLQEVFEAEGIHADTARDGVTALSLLAERDYELVITDMRMPGMSGLDVLRAIQHEHPGVPMVVMTAFSRDSVLREAQVSGALRVLYKPLDLEHLVQLTRRLVSPEVSVLVVEDDADLRVNLAEVLLDSGGAVPHQAATVAQARKLAASTAFHAAIIDVRLPDGDGIELGLMLRAKSAHGELPIVFVTGYVSELHELLRGVLDCRRIHVLEKPFSTQALLRLVAPEA